MKQARAHFRHLILSLFALLLVYLPLACGVALDDIFLSKSGTNKGGLDGHKDIIQSWLDDTETLVNFVLPKLVTNADDVGKNDEPLRRNLVSWFNIRVKNNGGIYIVDRVAYGELRDKFSILSGFLNKQEAQWTGNDVVPWIFYNSDWEEETELYFDDDKHPIDEDGQILKKPSDPNYRPQANLRTFNPPNFNSLKDDTQELLNDMKKGSAPDWDKYAYWSSDVGDYELVERAERRRTGGFCDVGPKVDMFALTIGKILRDTITLCPDAFTEKAEKWETIQDGLQSDAATNDVVDLPLQETSPRSLTLFHELIHMTSEPDATPDKGTKPAECLQLITNKHFADARNNPDNIVFFAWSYYLEIKGNTNFKWNTGFKVRK